MAVIFARSRFVRQAHYNRATQVMLSIICLGARVHSLTGQYAPVGWTKSRKNTNYTIGNPQSRATFYFCVIKITVNCLSNFSRKERVHYIMRAQCTMHSWYSLASVHFFLSLLSFFRSNRFRFFFMCNVRIFPLLFLVLFQVKGL